jgi:prepilin-type processing-associated H-X9-DG protein
MILRRYHPRRLGLGRVEVALLVVFGLLGLGLALVALNKGREEAQRAQCTQHLKEIGAAMHRFEDGKVRTFLPAARIADRYATWAVQISPFLSLKDEENPLKEWDQGRPYYSQPEPIRTAQVALYYCPSRRQSPQTSLSGDVPSDGQPNQDHHAGALGDYACASGNGDPAHPWDSAKANGAIILGEVLRQEGDRILRWRGRTSLENLPRGQSYTILVGEKHVPLDGFGLAAQGDGSLYNGDYPASSARIGGPGHGLASGPDAPFRLNFGSYHPGICQFLFADGHVEAVAVSIHEEVLGRLLNRLQ